MSESIAKRLDAHDQVGIEDAILAAQKRFVEKPAHEVEGYLVVTLRQTADEDQVSAEVDIGGSTTCIGYMLDTLQKALAERDQVARNSLN